MNQIAPPFAATIPDDHERWDHLVPSACYQIRRCRLAFGAVWSTSSASGSLSGDAAEEARFCGADYMTLRPDAGQYGLFGFSSRAPKRPGRIVAWHSAAALLARMNSRPNWAGAWPLPDGRWWTVTVFRFKIQPDGDKIHDDEASAREFLLDRLSSDTWRPVYAPRAWNVPGNSDPTPLADVLGPWSLLSVGYAHALSPAVSRRSNLVRGAVLGGGLAVAGAALWVAVPYIEQWGATAPVVASLAPPVPGPLPHYTPGASTLLSCLAAANVNWPRKILAPGWQPVGFVCDGQTLTLSAVADRDTSPRLSRTANPDLQLDPAMETRASASVPLPPPASPIDRPPSSTEAELRRFLDLYCATPILVCKWLGTREMAPAQALDQKSPTAAKLIPRFAVVKWKLEIDAPPDVWGPMLLRLPDWALQRLVRAESGGKSLWTIEGVSHVAP